MADASTDKKITLFFLKNLNHQFWSVEKFLKKRGYEVVVETEIKSALEKITEIKPDYIFLAWDHKNEAIRQLPKAIYATVSGQVVPFIMSTQRDQIIQLESSGFENKLYPPLSGPAIIRVISKNEKKNQVFEQINKKAGPDKKTADMIQVKSAKTAAPESAKVKVRRSSAIATEEERKEFASQSRSQAQQFVKHKKKKGHALSSIVQEGVKGKLMKAIAEDISNNELLSAVQKQNTKNNLDSIIEREFSGPGTKESLLVAIEDEISQLKDLTNDERFQTKERILAVAQRELTDDIFPELPAEENDQGDEPTAAMLPKETKPLSQGQVIFLEESFSDSIKPEIFDLIETYADLADSETKLAETTLIYVLAIEELEWTGYLTVASENYLDAASAQVILNNWIKQMIHIERIDQGQNEAPEMADAVLFEMQVPKVDFSDFCSYKADFFKTVDYENKKTMIAFFSFSPFQVINSVHQKFDMLELSTEFLQPKRRIPFDANLYLPENKKFLLYLKPGSFFDDAQVSRLQSRKVKYIYSNMDYEQAILKYKAEFNLQALVSAYLRIKGSQS